ncbi:MAG TPA: peptidoglycan DD-metalloendopeptidase family protein [Thiobacillaceae bacterium]|nr:peptidoglycan DD-metalloendopeptidase family protein [Thiobacillaceae bacterium]
MRAAWSILIVLALAACTAPRPAPVVERGAMRSGTAPARAEAPRTTVQIAPSTDGRHTVQRGDTLYAIAFANNLDHREIAAWNRLASPDLILVGQVLRLTPPAGAVEVTPLDEEPLAERPLDERPLDESARNGPPTLREPQGVLLDYSEANWARASAPQTVTSTPERAVVAPVAPPVATAQPAPQTPRSDAPAASKSGWLWPAEGTLAGRFGAAGGKGIDIVGPRNSPILAVAPGKVVYSGSGLRGYGRLLIVKHAGEYLSAYAHNESILVKEGDTVSAGQKIALMGDTDTDRVKLHFEIRRYGKPLDPLAYLPERS